MSKKKEVFEFMFSTSKLEAGIMIVSLSVVAAVIIFTIIEAIYI